MFIEIFYNLRKRPQSGNTISDLQRVCLLRGSMNACAQGQRTSEDIERIKIQVGNINLFLNDVREFSLTFVNVVRG